MKPIKFLTFILLAALVFMPMQTVLARGMGEGRIIFGSSYTLESGKTLEGDLVVIGGAATIETGAKVIGNTVVVGGSLVMDGEVTGDVALVGGAVTLGAASHIHGNLSTVGAVLTRAEGSLVDGEIFNTATSWKLPENQPVTPQPLIPITPPVSVTISPFWKVANVFGQALVLGILAMLGLLFLAPHTQRGGTAIVSQPFIAGTLGLLTVILTPLALVLLIITIVLIPVAFVAVIVLVLAAVLGWIALGLELGQRLTAAFKQQWHPSLAGGFGTFLLALVASAIGLIACVGWLVPFLVTIVGIGGVFMTRFGMQSNALPAAQKTAEDIVPPPA